MFMHWSDKLRAWHRKGSRECGWLHVTRRIHIRSCNKMAALGYVYTLRKQTLCSPERCTSWNATSAEFLEVQIPPPVLVYDCIRRCPVWFPLIISRDLGMSEKRRNKWWYLSSYFDPSHSFRITSPNSLKCTQEHSKTDLVPLILKECDGSK